jgi:diguanylate cyclase (GGDEF)-like protein
MMKAHILLVGSFDKKFLKDISNEQWEITNYSDSWRSITSLESRAVDLVIARDLIDQLTGYDLCLLIKSHPWAANVPFILLAEKKRQDYSLGGHLTPFPDRIAEYAEVIKKPQSLAKLIKEDLTSLNNKGRVKNEQPMRLLPTGLVPADKQDLINKLMTSLLLERSVSKLMLGLADRDKPKKQLVKEFAHAAQRMLKADLCGMAISSMNKPWLSLWGNKSLSKEACAGLVDKIKADMVTTANLSIDTNFEVDPNSRSKISDLLILPILSEGASCGMLIFAKYNEQKFTPLERTIINYMEWHAKPVIEFLLLQQQVDDLQGQKAVRAAIDPLTGVYNIEFLIGFLQQQLLFSFRNKLPVSLLMVDIDRFSQINEALGVAAGDMILAKLAERLLATIRSSDLLAHYSSDRFIAVLPNTEMKGAKVLAEKLRLEVEQANFFAGKQSGPSVTISIGCAQFDPADLNPESILKDAKLALQRAKEAGRNKVAV